MIHVDCTADSPGSSFKLLCPVCGEVWGEVRRGGAWFGLVRRCREHADRTHVGGSLFQDFDWAAGDPLAVIASDLVLLRHEFEVTIAWAERFLP